MRALIIVILVLGLAAVAQAGGKKYEVGSEYPVPPVRGSIGKWFEPGAPCNPIVIRENGRKVGTVKPKYGWVPGDIGKPGSANNPWVIEVEE